MVLPEDDCMNIDNTRELRDALFHAICILDHANPENDTDHRDVAAARELAKLRDLLNKHAYAPLVETPTSQPATKRRATR
jgi:hypothetical protein